MRLASLLFLISLLSACGSTPAVNGSAGLNGKNGTNGTNGTPGATGPSGPGGADGGTITSNVDCSANVNAGATEGNEQVILNFQVTKFQSGAGYIACSVTTPSGTFSDTKYVSVAAGTQTCFVTAELQNDTGSGYFWTFTASSTGSYSATYSNPGIVNYTYTSGQCSNI